MKPNQQMGNQMRSQMQMPNMDAANAMRQQYQQQQPDNTGIAGGMLGGMGNIQQYLQQQRMGPQQRPGMPLPPSAQPRGGVPDLAGVQNAIQSRMQQMQQPNYGNPNMNLDTGQPMPGQPMAGVDSAAGFQPPQMQQRNAPDMMAMQQKLAQSMQQANAQRNAFRTANPVGGSINAAMPAGKMQGGMNPYAQQLQQTRANPALRNSVTTKMRPTMKSDMSGKPPALKFSNPISSKRLATTGPQKPFSPTGPSGGKRAALPGDRARFLSSIKKPGGPVF